MTTFTFQDLTETPEEKEAMDAIQNQVENPSTTQTETIQGASGAQYTPVNLKEFYKPLEEINKAQPIEQLAQQLTQTFNQLINALLDLQVQAQPVSSSSGDLAEAVGTVLEQAQWFKDLVEETTADRVSDLDFEYEIGDHVERYMRNQFDVSDHVDIDALVQDKLDDILDGVVEEKLAEALEEKLSDISITFN